MFRLGQTVNEFSELPLEPSHRQIVVVLDQVAIDRLDMDDSRSLVRRTDVAVLNADRPASGTSSLVARLALERLLAPGNVLIQSPYKADQYVDAEDAPESFALDKFGVLSMVAQQLGAKSVSVTSVEDDRTEDRWDAGGEAGLGAVRGTLSAKRSRAASFARKVQLHDEFTGGPADLDAAEAHLDEWSLGHDRDLRRLVEARRIQNNSLKTRKLTVDLSRETERSLTAAANLTLPSFVKPRLDLNRLSKDAARYRLEYLVKF